MKQLVQYINEAFNSKPLYKYTAEIREFFDKYKLTMEKNQKKIDKFEKDKEAGKLPRRPSQANYPTLTRNTAFKAYPMAIIIDKFGYEEKLIKKYLWRDEMETDWEDYAEFIVSKCKEEGKTINDLAKWWYDYDNEIIKKNWEDPKWLLKQIDIERFWNPYYPNDDSCLKGVIENPSKIFSYIKSDSTSYWNLTQDEREQVLNYYTDPTNAESLSKAIKSARKKIEAGRPTYTNASKKWLKDIISKTTFEGGLFDKDFNIDKAYDEESNRDRRMYQGTNHRNELASAMISLITKVLEEKFNIKDDPTEFVDNADYIKVIVKDLGPSKKGSESGSISSSSFWTFYNYDFNVKIIKKNGNDEEELLDKKYENITCASSYYSGGW